MRDNGRERDRERKEREGEREREGESGRERERRGEVVLFFFLTKYKTVFHFTTFYFLFIPKCKCTTMMLEILYCYKLFVVARVPYIINPFKAKYEPVHDFI